VQVEERDRAAGVREGVLDRAEQGKLFVVLGGASRARKRGDRRVAPAAVQVALEVAHALGERGAIAGEDHEIARVE
jgi:hypothetical protein